MEPTVDAATIESLAAKLGALELTAAERDALDLLYERAGRGDAAEVAGFSYDAREQASKYSPLDLSPAGRKLVIALGVTSWAAPNQG
jgi:hypothetical protein